MSDNRDAVITGVGVVSPIGIGKDAFWDSLLAGRSGVRQLDGPLGSVPSHGFGGALVDFDPKAHVRPRKALKVMCREIQTAFAASNLAFDDAKLTSESLPAERIGTVFGSEMMSGEPEELIDTMIDCDVTAGEPRQRDFGESAMRKVYPLWLLKYLPNMATCHVGIVLGALGPNNTIVLGDTSASAAMAESLSVLQRDLADVMVTGAAGTRLSPTRTIFTGGLDPGSRHQPVDASSRPMGKDRNGVVGGEAAAILVLESAFSARQRGVKPLAQVLGTASRFIAVHPDSPRQRDSIQRAIHLSLESALNKAGLSSGDVGAVVSHAMGDPHIDAAEAQVIERVLGSDVPVFAPIASIGHSGSASGAIGLAAATLMLDHQQIPQTVNAAERDPDCRVNLLTRTTRLSKPAVVVLSHTNQGNAVTVVLHRA